MKILVVLSLLIFTVTAFAIDPVTGPQKKGDSIWVNRHKKEVLEDTDQEIAGLQAYKACMASVQDLDASKKCLEEKNTRDQERRSRQKERRQAQMAEYTKRLQEQKDRPKQKTGK